MTINLGWWLLPLAISIVSIVYANIGFNKLDAQRTGHWRDAFLAPVYMLCVGAAAIVYLASWLIWALIT